MKPIVLVDTGPLVAFLSADDAHHGWVSEHWQTLRAPLLTCDAVITESVFLLQREGFSVDGIFELLRRGTVRLDFSLADEAESVATLINRYSRTPMSLADACLVRMSEIHSNAQVFTLDKHFRIYRRNGRAVIPLLAPW